MLAHGIAFNFWVLIEYILIIECGLYSIRKMSWDNFVVILRYISKKWLDLMSKNENVGVKDCTFMYCTQLQFIGTRA